MSRPSGRGHVSGPLSEYGENFREWLFDRGYTGGSAAHQVRVMAFARTTPVGTATGRYRPPDELLAFLEALGST